MSTRALIVRVNKITKCIEYGQTYMDGYNNTLLLNEFHKNSKSVGEIFDRLTTSEHPDKFGGYGHGIHHINSDGKIVWFENESYNCGTCSIDEFEKIMLSFDYPEYASFWGGRKWHNFVLDDNKDRKRFGRFVNNKLKKLFNQ